MSKSSIIYADNTKNIYDKNGHIATNWDPNADYGNEYVRVHFRIDAKYYQYPFTNIDEGARDAFREETIKIMKTLGWNVAEKATTSTGSTVSKGKAHLYLHPQDFSGIVLKNDVKAIAEALEKKETFSLRWVDLYETVFDMSDDEYQEYLCKRRLDIECSLFEKCTTRRSNMFYRMCDICKKVAKTYGLHRITDYDISIASFTIDYVKTLLKEMIQRGLIVCVDSKDELFQMVRSITKAEQKETELCFELLDTSAEELALKFKTGDIRYLVMFLRDDGYDYTFYDKKYQELDGGVYDDTSVSFVQALSYILEDADLSIADAKVMDYQTIFQKIA